FAAPRAADAAPVAPERHWNDFFGRLLVNAGQARQWGPAGVVARERMLAGTTRVAPGAVKIRVYDTGIHGVRASRAIASGFPSGQSVDQLRLFRRLYDDVTLSPSETDVVFDVIEDAAGTPGIFDGADRLVFYGISLRDEVTQADQHQNYCSYNVYWLEPAPGSRMTVRTPPAGFVTADTALATFPATRHVEIDNAFREGTPSETYDLYYYNYGDEPGPVDMPFKMDTVQPGTSLTLNADLHGQTYDSRAVRVSLVNSKGEKVLNSLFQVRQKNRYTFTGVIAASDLDIGTNQFRLGRPDTQNPSVQVILNYLDLTYSALYRARGNSLRFNSAALAGDTSLTVTGITSTTGLQLFDITDPSRPEHLSLDARHFTAVAGGTAVSFRASLAGRREYVLVPVAKMIDVAAADVVADIPSAIIGGGAENGVDVLVVAHRDFLAGMSQWVTYRRAQGYRVLMADVDDVFDEFNGGVRSARAIQRFARHFFEHADASALVLVGDASTDHRNLHPDSGPDFVPTFHRIDNVRAGLTKDEVVSTDKRMVKFPGPGGVDPVPDMIIGRLPVGDTGELQVVLAKIFSYESPGPSDFWRKRMILVADDSFSEGNSSFTPGFSYCCNSAEVGFQTGTEDVAQTIETSLPAGYDVVRFFFSQYSSAWYPTCGPSSDCASTNYPRRDSVRNTRNGANSATESLMRELNAGATWVAIQAHMNRYVVTHERLLSGEPAQLLESNTGRDYLRVENRFKPWIIFGMGCHFSEYAIWREFGQDRLIGNDPNGDSFAEQFLFQDERGAVATYGSSGFEYLGPNNDFMSRVAQVWFYSAPYDTMVNQTQAEWKFGEIMFLAEAQLAPVSIQFEPVERYTILGDPMLRIDAGPPRFDVTVNGRTVESGDLIGAGGERDSIRVVATVTDENALHKFGLEIDGQDMTDSLTVERLTDPQLPRARQYRLSFRHLVMPRTYDIVLRAYQAPDTTAGEYHMAAEFVLKVESSITVSVNGRAIESGAAVPADANYRVDLAFPVYVPSSEIVVSIDDVAVADAQFAHPSAEDSLAWIVTFRKKLDAGTHHMLVTAGDIEFKFQLRVSEAGGLEHVVNYPNPFRGDGTRFVYTNEVEITGGTIDIFTVRGKKVRRLDIPSTARQPGQNSVFWDGRDAGGGAVGNGTYLYVINVKQRSGSATVRGSLSKIE
ncbi:MAG TPA: C25 family cysteine peptidase, partial [Candidatus Krumholzibacteria bacterium]